MLRRLSMALAATGISALTAGAFAQWPMHDTWDINAPNGVPTVDVSQRVAATPAAHGAHGHAATRRADRVIEVRPGMKHVNVQDGETVLFKAGAKSFAWTFEPTLLHTPFDLTQIAPAGIDVQGIQVYCDPTPYERAG